MLTVKSWPVTVMRSPVSVAVTTGTDVTGVGTTGGLLKLTGSCCLATSKPAAAHGVAVRSLNDSCRKCSSPGAGSAGRWTGSCTVLFDSGGMSSCAAVNSPLWTTVPSATSDQLPANSLTLVNRYSLVIRTVPAVPVSATLIAW